MATLVIRDSDNDEIYGVFNFKDERVKDCAIEIIHKVRRELGEFWTMDDIVDALTDELSVHISDCILEEIEECII